MSLRAVSRGVGGGGGGGNVSSVGIVSPLGTMNVANTPVTSTGNISIDLANPIINQQTFNNGIVLPNAAPGVTTNALYGVGGNVFWSGSKINLWAVSGNNISFTGGYVGIGSANPQTQIYVNGTVNGWIASSFGIDDGVSDRVVVGNFSNGATIGAHNGTISGWVPLNINPNADVNLGNSATQTSSMGDFTARGNLTCLGLTGYLYGNGGSFVTASSSIPNAGLANNSVTLGTTMVALGSTETVIDGIGLTNATTIVAATLSGTNTAANNFTFNNILIDASFNYQLLADAFTYTLPDSVTYTLIDASGSLTSGTIIMPATPVDSQIVRLGFARPIATLTINPNSGQNIIGTLATTVPGSVIAWIYDTGNTTWYPYT